MATYVTDFLENNNVFFIHINFDFEKNHSTSHAIITIVEIISKALDTGIYVVGVFLDLKKAIDTVDHNILLEKIKLWNQREYTQMVQELSNEKISIC